MISSFKSEDALAPGGATGGLTLLLVEDDELSRELASLRLNGLFKRIIEAVDGDEGFQLFQEHAPDIVLSDQVMPGLSGLEMLRKIRVMDQQVPFILMTSSMDNEILLEAINLGVSKFIPKPFDFDVLLRLLSDMADELINKRLLKQCRLQEIELLRYRDSYNSMQQEAARRKERHVARHDLRNQVVTGAADIRWGLRVTNAPKDIMSGDGYTIRNLFDGRQLVFVVDAMGSGLSASLSALLATSFCNYQVEHLHQWSTFSLNIFLKRFQEYMSCILLEDEALSCGFLLVDLMSQEIEIAAFGMPPLLVRKLDGTTDRVLGTNPPLTIYNGEAATIRRSLADVADVMIMTDGITEATLQSGGEYRERLENDFRTSPTLAALLYQFMLHTANTDLDDLTLLHLQRLDLPASWSWSCEPVPRMEHLVDTVRIFLEELAEQVVLDHDEQGELETVLQEALANALEHGCLGIDRTEKALLVQRGEYEEALAGNVAALGAYIRVSATLWRGAGRPLLIVEIQDNGPGLMSDQLWNMPEGSGLKKIRSRCDSVFVGGPGCRLLVLKTIEGGEIYGDSAEGQ